MCEKQNKPDRVSSERIKRRAERSLARGPSDPQGPGLGYNNAGGLFFFSLAPTRFCQPRRERRNPPSAAELCQKDVLFNIHQSFKQKSALRLHRQLQCVCSDGAAPHIHVLLPDSSYILTTSNIPVAPEPNDVYRHALCPSSSLRPNAPFQLLRTGRWRCAPGGCAHGSVLFASCLG